MHITCTFELFEAWGSFYHVVVTSPDGSQSMLPCGFEVLPNPDPMYLNNVTPNEASQFAMFVNLELDGYGFKPGAVVRLKQGQRTINAFSVNVASESKITCTVLLFGAEPGEYAVDFINPDGMGARRSYGFYITSACGQGSGSAVLLFGLLMGLITITGTVRLRAKRRKGERDQD